MTIYLDADYRCHLTDDGTMREVEIDFFDGKCATYIEGYRLIPAGESWTREDGVVFHGEMIAPAEDYSALTGAQAQYELDEAAHLEELGIPQEQGFTATRNYSIGSFIGIYGKLYEVISAIPMYSSIQDKQNVIKTTIEHYLDTIKEE